MLESLEGFEDVFYFIYNVFYSLVLFISAHKLVMFFILVPIAFTILYIVFDFVFDIGHMLDGYNAKKSFAFKGYSKYEKQQAQLRKQEEIEQRKVEKQVINRQHKPKMSYKQGRALEKYYYEASKKENKIHDNLDIYVEE